jgi:type IV pilus assembly protein PilP
MKRSLPILCASLLLLQGCYDDLTDIQQFMNTVKTSTPAKIPPLPEVKEFVHISYKSAQSRSPFSAPRPEAVQEKYAQIQDCLSPDPARRKEPLEKYALDNLKMRGTLGDENDIWALIEASDKTLHRISKNNYIGLFHGRVINVDPAQVELLELIPDGAGCWKERTTVLPMAEPAAVASK